MLIAIFVFAGWIFSLCLHEFGHSIVAYAGGDKSVKDRGYLTFNPLKYADPTTSLVLPLIFLMLGGIALPGGAVYIHTASLRNRLWVSAVALAGPAMTLFAAFLCGSPFLFHINIPDATGAVGKSLAVLTLLNSVSFVLNLMPVPGLDGYGIIEPWLPKPIRAGLKQVSGIAIFVFFACLWLIQPLNSAMWRFALDLSRNTFGVPGELILTGWESFENVAKNAAVGLIILLFVLRKSGRKK